MFNFLIDTADEKYIKNKWDFLKQHISGKYVVGITTNPNAFYKVNDFSMEQWFSRAKKLADLLEQIRGDKEGELHIQFPNSELTEDLFKKWCDKLESLNLSNIKLFIKVPPFSNCLEIAEKYFKNINVTGVSDSGTALNALSYEISYLSIIPGRMEEVGINAKNHVKYIQSRKKDNKKIITGSMRTLECLKWCVELDTVPTIGTRVFDLFNENNIKDIVQWEKQEFENIKFCPFIDERNVSLSTNFFKQMDEMGELCYKNLLGAF